MQSGHPSVLGCTLHCSTCTALRERTQASRTAAHVRSSAHAHMPVPALMVLKAHVVCFEVHTVWASRVSDTCISHPPELHCASCLGVFRRPPSPTLLSSSSLLPPPSPLSCSEPGRRENCRGLLSGTDRHSWRFRHCQQRHMAAGHWSSWRSGRLYFERGRGGGWKRGEVRCGSQAEERGGEGDGEGGGGLLFARGQVREREKRGRARVVLAGRVGEEETMNTAVVDDTCSVSSREAYIVTLPGG